MSAASDGPSGGGPSIEEVHEASAELLEAFRRLLPQLSTSAAPLELPMLEEIVGSEASRLLIARDEGGRIVGSLTLVVFAIPTGRRAWIEDVIVDADARGQGIGVALTRAAIELATATGARTVDLTTRPSRVAANRMYERVGFAARETNTYRFTP